MRLRRSKVGFALSFLILSFSSYAETSRWVHADAHGGLSYQPLNDKGSKIVDFSYAGYGGGGVEIPAVPVRVDVAPPNGQDDSEAIQQAIDKASALPLLHGVRGAVQLQDGVYHCSKTLTISADGVVLRGKGNHTSVIALIGAPHLGIQLLGQAVSRAVDAEEPIVDEYLPSGARSIHIETGSSFHPGDIVRITRPVTPRWVAFMGMDGLMRNGKKETWITGDTQTERVVVAISGNTLTLDAPLTDSYDADYLGRGGSTVVRISHAGNGQSDARLQQAGVENLEITMPAQSIKLGEPEFDGIELKAVKDGWVRDVAMVNTINGLTVDAASQRITLTKVNIKNSVVQGAALPFDFSLAGTQILCDRCSGTGDHIWYVATQARGTGPNVVLNAVFHGNGSISPHQRWSTGLLIDSSAVPQGSIIMQNRGEMGSGHGWTMGWGVIWNSVAKDLIVQAPPGSMNWSIGNRGEQRLAAMPTFPNEHGPKLPQGIIELQDRTVAPASLYLAQLKSRLGAQALANIGY